MTLDNTGEDRIRAAREAAGRFMTAMAGNLPGFEEDSRALYAGDDERFGQLIRDWPADIREHLERLVGRSPSPVIDDPGTGYRPWAGFSPRPR